MIRFFSWLAFPALVLTAAATVSATDTPVPVTPTEKMYAKVALELKNREKERRKEAAQRIANDEMGNAEWMAGIVKVPLNGVKKIIEDGRARRMEEVRDILIGARLYIVDRDTNPTSAKEVLRLTDKARSHYRKFKEGKKDVTKDVTLDAMILKAHRIVDDLNKDGSLITNPERPVSLLKLMRRVQADLEEAYPLPHKPQS